MKIKTIKVEVTKTIQATRFEPVSVTFGAEAELEAGDNVAEAKKELYDSVTKTVRAMMKRELIHWKAQAEDKEED